MATIKRHILAFLTLGKVCVNALSLKNTKYKVLVSRQKIESLRRWEEEGGNLGFPLTGENYDWP